MWGCGRLGAAHVTLAEVLKSSGYRTAAVVGGPFCTANGGFYQGFDYYEDRLPGSTPFLSQLINRLTPDLFSAVGKRRADQGNGFVFKWLERNSSAPFFLFINYFDAHLRLNPKPRYRAAFEGDYGLLHGFLMSQGDYDSDVTQRTRTPGEAEHAHWRTLYDCEILFLDSELGRLFRTLKELGVYDNSIIVITSDHGNSFGEHHLAGHGGWVFEEQVRVPLVIRHPFGRLGGTKDSERIGLVNLFSLILNEAGIEVPPTAHPAHPDSLNDVCVLENGRKNPAGRWKFAYVDRDLRAIYVGPFKLVTADDQPIELYNLDQDPGESVNLLEADSLTAQTLRDKLAELLKTMLPAPEEEEGEDTIDKKLLEQMKSVGYL